jgi:hypothetical protein
VIAMITPMKLARLVRWDLLAVSGTGGVN